MNHTRNGSKARKRRQESALERQDRYNELAFIEKLAQAYERGGDCKEYRRLAAQSEVAKNLVKDL